MSNLNSTKVAASAMMLVLATAFVVPSLMPDASAGHAPADKVAVSGSALEILSDVLEEEGSGSEEVVLLEGSMRASSPTDLIFQVTLECAIWTDVITIGNDESRSFAQVVVWGEIDGEPIPVSGDDTGAPGEVVFCNRTHRQTTSLFENENATIEQFLSTRSANAFNWMAIDVGSGIHTLTVKARLDTELDGMGMAQAGVGKRTLVVEPVKLANDVVI